MAKKIFIAATGQNCGKTTMSISLMHLARKKYQRVGFIKPIGPKIECYSNMKLDMDAILMARTYNLEQDISLMNPVPLHRGFTREFLDGKIDARALADSIVRAVAELESKNDLLIIEGAGHGGVGAVIGLSNAYVASLVKAPVMIVAGSGIGNVIDAVHLNLALYEREQADVRLIMTNKLISEKRDTTLKYLKRAFDYSLEVSGGFNYSPILANPTLAHISKLLNLPLQGDQGVRNRIIHHIQLGAASSQKVVDGLLESTLLIVTSSRDELIVTLSSLYNIPAWREKIAGIVIAGHAPVSMISQQILDRSDIPYIRIHETTANVFTALSEDVSKITAEDQEKLAWIQANAEHDIDFEMIDRIF
ncbi:AAA family ATPase [Geobacter pelophilus]|uniref:AAA family ATPase n=1 Tax=Geoanaerobacter pelophilus TaxID=60036 RepID=A0AAW4L9P2_9BACT|nr:AAA family ATPase [Geoanaerobacter pelophilus]MBT0664567.1 AAA family ATPase [Geoanaerobacter pelophilus]